MHAGEEWPPQTTAPLFRLPLKCPFLPDAQGQGQDLLGSCPEILSCVLSELYGYYGVLFLIGETILYCAVSFSLWHLLGKWC